MTLTINTNQINHTATSFKGGAPKTYTIKNGFIEKGVEKIGKVCSSTENRLILGVTALATQPWIDLHNKDVDEKTRNVSCARAIAKAVAGTTVGVIVRYSCIKFIKKLTHTPKEIEELAKKGVKVTKWSSALLPNSLKNKEGIKEAINIKAFEDSVRLLRNHRNALGTSLAILVSLFTNFIIDVPITKFLTNLIVGKFDEADKRKSASKGGK